MKKTTLNSLYESLRDMKYPVKVEEEIRLKGLNAIQRMLEVPRNY